jgi:3-oxoadipate enol-lactonase
MEKRLDKKNIDFVYYDPSPPVVFFNAFPVNQNMWKPQQEYLKKKEYSFITFDYPGLGDRENSLIELSLENYGEIIYDYLSNIDIRKAIFVGLSMGGYILFSLFRKHPDIFSGLLLANTKASADDIEVRNRRFSMINQLKENPDLDPVIDFHISKFFTKESQKNNPDMIESVKNMMKESTVAGIIQAQRAMAKRLDSFGLLSHMDFPVSIITGKDDELITIEECRQMHHKIKDCKLYIIEKAAHLSNMENPEQFNQILFELIERSNKKERRR